MRHPLINTKARPWRKLYATARWQKLRELKLSHNPICERCLDQEIVEPATVVHHRKPHKGEDTLFHDFDNLEALCKPHHDRDGRLEDNGKTVIRFGPDGWPL